MNRHRLANRRDHELLTFRHRNQVYIGGLGRFPDGRIAELFIDGPKVGSELETQARDAAIIASFALQHGADVETLRLAVGREESLVLGQIGKASSALGALLDLIAKTDRERTLATAGSATP